MFEYCPQHSPSIRSPRPLNYVGNIDCSSHGIYFMWTPHPVIMTIRDSREGPIIFLLYHYYRVGGPPKIYYGPG